MVAETTERLLSTWPVSLRWRLLAALGVLAATAVAIFLLSLDGEEAPEVLVVATTQRWLEGYPVGDHALVPVPADLAALFAVPTDLEEQVAAVDVPEGSLVSPQMLRPVRPRDTSRQTTLMTFGVSAGLWPNPGPRAGDIAVFSSSPGGCATTTQPLTAVEGDTEQLKVTVQATPQLAQTLADYEWWIWEAPPGGWPQCVSSERGVG
ncbi:MAG: hypothetical protein OXE93_09050 [bacterium]|nr:hypothetical protein [bacterium]